MIPSLKSMTHEEIRTWLQSALTGQISLPLLTIDEPLHLGLARIEREFDAPTRRSLDTATFELIKEIYENPLQNEEYVRELVFLSGKLKVVETLPLLASLALRFDKYPDLSISVQQAILSVLADSTPPQQPNFWQLIFEQAPRRFGAISIAALLRLDPTRALALLSHLPSNQRLAEIVSLNIDIYYDELPWYTRDEFIRGITKTLSTCNSQIRDELENWISTKTDSKFHESKPREILSFALRESLGEAAAPRRTTTKLCDFSLELT